MFSVFFIAQKSSYKCEKKIIENVEKRSNQRRQINESLKGKRERPEENFLHTQCMHEIHVNSLCYLHLVMFSKGSWTSIIS